jgi:hypothetical protein
MKKLLVAAVAGLFLLCSTAPLSAAELSNYGFMKFVGQFTDNYYGSTNLLADEQGASDFAVNQRARTWFDFTVSENLKATVGLEWDSAWGDGGFDVGRNSGLGLGGDSNMIETKHLYMDFTFPGTEVAVRMGQFWTELPSNFGSSILGGDTPGVQMNAPLSDQMDLTLGWTRPKDLDGGFDRDSDQDSGDENDLIYASLPISGDGFSLTPFGVYGFMGDGDTIGAIGYGAATSLGAIGNYVDADGEDVLGNGFGQLGDDADAWWAGVSGDVTMMDPIVFLYDFNYGSIEGDDAETAGYVADLAFQYRMNRMTFELMGFYGSGDDASDLINDDGSWKDNPEGGRMPVYFTESFGPTGLGYSNCFACTGPIADGVFSYHQAGMWSAGISLKDIVFSDKLTGALQLRYNEGTNDKELAEAGIYLNPANNQLTEEDSAVELGAQVDYALYENLTASIDAGYINMDIDEGVWGQEYEEDITRVAAGLTYSW